jgi:preprotein translocase subunit SecG
MWLFALGLLASLSHTLLAAFFGQSNIVQSISFSCIFLFAGNLLSSSRSTEKARLPIYLIIIIEFLFNRYLQASLSLDESLLHKLIWLIRIFFALISLLLIISYHRNHTHIDENQNKVLHRIDERNSQILEILNINASTNNKLMRRLNKNFQTIMMDMETLKSCNYNLSSNNNNKKCANMKNEINNSINKNELKSKINAEVILNQQQSIESRKRINK